MLSTLKSTVLAASLALAMGAAHADAGVAKGGSLGDLDLVSYAVLADLALGDGTGLYSASWTFTLSQASKVTGYIDWLGPITLTSITAGGATDTTPATYDLGVLAKGSYTLSISGALPAYTYSYYTSRISASPVPEPESLALMGAGLLVTAGAVYRRRRQA
jgi:hypothetical protein